MKQYLDLLQRILDEGEFRADRTGTRHVPHFRVEEEIFVMMRLIHIYSKLR